MGEPTSIISLGCVVLNDSLNYEDVQVDTLDLRLEGLEGATYEAEVAMKAKYPHLFPSGSIPK